MSALTWLLHLAASGAAAAVLLAALGGNSIALAFESATGLGLFHVAALALGLIPVLYATTFRRAGSAWLQRISSQQAGDSDRRLEWLLIAILVCIGFTLRIARIGEYGFSADECIGRISPGFLGERVSNLSAWLGSARETRAGGASGEELQAAFSKARLAGWSRESGMADVRATPNLER